MGEVVSHCLPHRHVWVSNLSEVAGLWQGHSQTNILGIFDLEFFDLAFLLGVFCLGIFKLGFMILVLYFFYLGVFH